MSYALPVWAIVMSTLSISEGDYGFAWFISGVGVIITMLVPVKNPNQ